MPDRIIRSHSVRVDIAASSNTPECSHDSTSYLVPMSAIMAPWRGISTPTKMKNSLWVSDASILAGNCSGSGRFLLIWIGLVCCKHAAAQRHAGGDDGTVVHTKFGRSRAATGKQIIKSVRSGTKPRIRLLAWKNCPGDTQQDPELLHCPAGEKGRVN